MLAGKKYISLTIEIGIDVDSILFSTAAVIGGLDNEIFLISSSSTRIVLWRGCIPFIITCGTHFALTAHIMSRYLKSNFGGGTRRIATFSGILAHVVTFYSAVPVCEHFLRVCVTGTVGYVCRSRSGLHLLIRKTGARWAMLSFTPLIRTLVGFRSNRNISPSLYNLRCNIAIFAIFQKVFYRSWVKRRRMVSHVDSCHNHGAASAWD
jgi:hypothetical protein